jgi:hypothetical protein
MLMKRDAVEMTNDEGMTKSENERESDDSFWDGGGVFREEPATVLDEACAAGSNLFRTGAAAKKMSNKTIVFCRRPNSSFVIPSSFVIRASSFNNVSAH